MRLCNSEQLTCRRDRGKTVLGFARDKLHYPGAPRRGQAGGFFAKRIGREAEAMDGDFLSARAGMGPRARGGVIIKAAQGV